MDYRTQLLQAAEEYCRRTGLSRATVATKAANDGKFFDRVEAGGGCTMKMFERVMAYLKDEAA